MSILEPMDLSWLQKFSGGLDLIPVGIAIAGAVLAVQRIEIILLDDMKK